MPDLIEPARESHRLGGVVLGKFELRMFIQVTEVLGGAGNEVIEADYFMTFFEQTIAQMRADKTSGSRNKMTRQGSLFV